MSKRTIKTREQILTQIQELRTDLYYSFGVPDGGHSGYPVEQDPDVHLDLDSARKMVWGNDVKRGLDHFHTAFACLKGMPQPKSPLVGPRARRCKTKTFQND